MNEMYKDILKKTTILLVDDNEETRIIFKNTISNYVNTIYEASNGNEAMDIYNSKNPNIIITDIEMPLMNGLLFINNIREIDKKVPIIVISAYSEVDTLRELISLKLIDYLIKPLKLKEFTSILIKCAIEIENSGIIEVKLTKDVIYSYSKKVLIKNDIVVSLTPNEIALIELLIENENKVVTKFQLEDSIYNTELVSDNAINVLVSKVRKKIGKNIIIAIPSHGYKLIKED